MPPRNWKELPATDRFSFPKQQMSSNHSNGFKMIQMAQPVDGRHVFLHPISSKQVFHCCFFPKLQSFWSTSTSSSSGLLLGVGGGVLVQHDPACVQGVLILRRISERLPVPRFSFLHGTRFCMGWKNGGLKDLIGFTPPKRIMETLPTGCCPLPCL